MPIVFDEIRGEIAPERGAERGEHPAQPAAAQATDPAEVLRRELQLMRERERRQIAD